MVDAAEAGRTVQHMPENLPPRAVGPDGRVLSPASGGSDPVAQILAAGERGRERMSRRVRAIAAATVTLIVAVLIMGVGATNLADTPQQREARAADQQVRQLTEYATSLRDGRAAFPPASGLVVATETSSDLWRVTIRSLDGRCWQVLATTVTPQTPPAGSDGAQDAGRPDDARRVLAIETSPYQVEAIHCRFNP